MTKRKSLFEELNSLSLDKERLVEQKGEHIIAGAINLMEYIETTFDEDTAADLTKRLVCLLYTSPSPRDLSTSRMPSSA